MKPVVYVLSGVPGSGKSTICEKLAKATDAVVISTDNIRAELNGSAGDQSNGAAVFAIAYERFDKAVAEGRNVLWDSTNLDSESRGFVLSHVPSSYRKVAVYTDVSVEICKARNQARYESEIAKSDGDPRLVPEEVIDRMMSNYHHPTVAEGFDTIYRVDENGRMMTCAELRPDMCAVWQKSSNLHHTEHDKEVIIMTNKDKKIALAIIKAQIASDAGKGIYSLYRAVDGNNTPCNEGYEMKEDLIEKAIRGIQTSQNSSFRYSCVWSGDYIITYFEYRNEEGRRKQISFHTPSWEITRFLRSIANSRKTRKTAWDGNEGGSRDNCYDLAVSLGIARS